MELNSAETIHMYVFKYWHELVEQYWRKLSKRLTNEMCGVH